MDSDTIQASESFQESPSPAESGLETSYPDQLADSPQDGVEADVDVPGYEDGNSEAHLKSPVAGIQPVQPQSAADDRGELGQQPSTEQSGLMESEQPSASGLDPGSVPHSTAGSEVDTSCNELAAHGVTASSFEADSGREGAASPEAGQGPPEADPETFSRHSAGVVPGTAPSPEAAVPDPDPGAISQEVEQPQPRPSQDGDQQPSFLTDDAPLTTGAASNDASTPAEPQAARQQAQDASSSDRQHQEADKQVEDSHFSHLQPEASSTSQTSTGAPRRAAKFVSKRIGQPRSRSPLRLHSRQAHPSMLAEPWPQSSQ